MLTGKTTPTSGEAYLDGFSIISQQTQLRQLIGYCPQIDPLFDLLTGREHIELYAKIKNVPPHKRQKAIERMLHDLSLTKYADTLVGTYSGGNKRKLSVACALIGSPSIVFLDEPSTGMDPLSRRFMWNFISRTMKNRSVILTTHSMEEAEALCQRIGIMVNGKLVCLGTSNHLKMKYGQGFQLEITTKSQDKVNHFVQHHFPLSRITIEYEGHLKIHLTKQAIGNHTLGSLFTLIENNRTSLDILDYSLSQTTLEKVFIYSLNKSLSEHSPTVNKLH